MKLSNTYQHKQELRKLARVFRNSSNNLAKGNIKVLITHEREKQLHIKLTSNLEMLV